MTATNAAPRRALRTAEAARYLGVSVSLLRKWRLKGVADPGDHGPEFIRVSPTVILYELRALDAWFDERRGAPRSAA